MADSGNRFTLSFLSHYNLAVLHLQLNKTTTEVYPFTLMFIITTFVD